MEETMNTCCGFRKEQQRESACNAIAVGGVVVVFTLLMAAPGFAQSTFGSVFGLVSDPTGAVVPGVQVTLTSLGTGVKQASETDASGRYEFTRVAPGDYRIDAEKAGFKRFTREPVTIEVQQAFEVDITMQLGEVSQRVEVKAATPLLQPETASLGQVVTERPATELPLNGRNVFNLLELAPSVVPQGQSTGTPVGTNPFGWGNYQINGSFGNQSAEYLDGQPLNIGYINLPVLIPTQDSVQEFKVQTNNLGPEWGKFAGGVMNLSTKSGTNQIHGEAYEFFRNNALNARDFFAATTPPFHQNQFGANAGGPVYLPGVYDGRDKTFWFFSWEGFRLREGQTFLTTVPTALEKQGIFTGLTDASGNPITIKNPLTGAPYANNVIPPNQLNPTSLKLLNLWPAPNIPGIQHGLYNNFLTEAGVGGNQNQEVARVDENITAKQRLAVRYSHWNVLDLPIDPLGTGLCADRCAEIYYTHAADADYVYTFGARTIGDFNVSLSRFDYNRNPKNAGFDLTSIGWPAAYNAEVPAPMRTPPTPCVTGMADTIMCTQGQSFIQDRNTQFNFSPNITMIRGPHTVQFGGQIELDYDNYAQTNVASGAFGFCAPGQSCFSGFGFSDFLLGYADNPASVENHFFGQAVVPAFTAGREVYRALYFGDTWHVTKKLTLDLGLRYEQQGPWTERYDRLSFFDPAAPSFLAQASGMPNLKGDVFLVNSLHDSSRSNQPLMTTNFAPRVGLAYRVTPRTVIRTGYGIFYIPNFVSFGVNPLNDTVNAAATSYLGTINGTVPVNSISTPFPNGISDPPGRKGNVQQFAVGVSSITETDLHNQLGYEQQWNFDIQQELPAKFFLDVAYAGSKGTHLPWYSQQIDQLPDQDLSLGPALEKVIPNPFFGLITTGPLSAPTTAAGQLLRPFPQYSSVSLAGQGSFGSSYNALELTGERRFAGGGTLLVAYTVSKLISNTDTLTQWLESGVGGIQDWNNLRGEYSLASQDVPQRVVISYVLDLPFGHGKKFLSSASGPVGKLVSGWGVDGVTTFQRGFPLEFSNGLFNGTTLFGGGSRPNVVAGCHRALSGSPESRLNEWFNTSCFSAPRNFTFGTESRTDPTLRVDGINNFDFALFKTTSFGPEERLGLQFRAEFFNIFNRPQFGYPNTTFGTPTFGEVTSTMPFTNPRLIQFALKFLF
jgi:hypothetical protein